MPDPVAVLGAAVFAVAGLFAICLGRVAGRKMPSPQERPDA